MYNRMPYKTGDRLWVREAFLSYQSGAESDISEHVVFYGDTVPVPAIYPPQKPKLTSPLFMPRKFSRLTLEITDVRCERLHDITLEDAMKEGYETGEVFNALHEFMMAWEALNNKRGFGWDTNPWVWVIEFKRVEKEEGGDAL